MNRNHWTTSDLTHIAIVVVPILILGGLMTASAISWHSEKAKLNADIQKLVGQGNTLDNSTMAPIYDQLTSQVHTLRWKNIITATQDLDEQYGGPFAWSTGDETYDAVVLAGEDWPVAGIMSSYAKDAEPIIDQIASLLDSDEAIWLPIVFQSFYTNLNEVQQFRSVARLMHYSFLNSIHEGNHARALTIIRANERLFGDSYEAVYLVDELVRMACHSIIQIDIRGSVAAGFWSDEELAEIELIVATGFEWDKRWKKVIDREMLATLPAMIDTGIGASGRDMGVPNMPLMLAPSTLRSAIESQEKIAMIGNTGTSDHVDQVELSNESQWLGNAKPTADHWLQLPTMSSIWITAFTPAYTAVASAYRREANSHRFTRTIIALRGYHHEFGRWPETLGDLTVVGLPLSEIEAFDGGPFFYEARDDGNAVVFNQADKDVKWTFKSEAAEQVFLAGPPL